MKYQETKPVASTGKIFRGFDLPSTQDEVKTSFLSLETNILFATNYPVAVRIQCAHEMLGNMSDTFRIMYI